MLDGQVPYRDFASSIRPARCPCSSLPALAAGERLPRRLRGARGGLRSGGDRCLARRRARRRPGAARCASTRRLAFAGLAPLALGLGRPHAIRPLARDADRRGAGGARRRDEYGSAFAVLGLAVAAKLYPARARSARARLRRAAAGPPRDGDLARSSSGSSSSSAFLPFALLAPDGLLASFERQTGRPLQIESLGSACSCSRPAALGAYEPTVVSSYGSQNLAGGAARRARTALTVAPGRGRRRASGSSFAHGRRGSRRSLLAGCGGRRLCTLVALGKVLSPQFLLWLIPLVPLVAGRRGVVASALLRRRARPDAALVPVPLLGPGRRLEAGPCGSLVARDLRPRRPARGCSSPLWHGHPHRLAASSAARRGIALDQRALDPDVALGRVEADGHAGRACARSPARRARRSPSRAARSCRRR